MKSPQQIAEAKYPLPFTAEPVATQNCTCYSCQIARREGYIAGMQEREKEVLYWRQRCEAAEGVLVHMTYDSNNPCNDYHEYTLSNDKWQSLKKQNQIQDK